MCVLVCWCARACFPLIACMHTSTHTQQHTWRSVNLSLHFICLHACVCICKCLYYLLPIYLFAFLLLPSSLSLLSYSLNPIPIHLFNNSICPFAVATACSGIHLHHGLHAAANVPPCCHINIYARSISIAQPFICCFTQTVLNSAAVCVWICLSLHSGIPITSCLCYQKALLKVFDTFNYGLRIKFYSIYIPPPPPIPFGD